MAEQTEFSKAQLRMWEKYEKVRKSGRYNMFMPEARQSTGLSKDDYLFVLMNYDKLKTAHNKAQKKREI